MKKSKFYTITEASVLIDFAVEIKCVKKTCGYFWSIEHTYFSL